jgi:hypothetical protein
MRVSRRTLGEMTWSLAHLRDASHLDEHSHLEICTCGNATIILCFVDSIFSS